MIGLTREIERRRPGSWAGTLFSHEPPLFGFSASEQRLLLTALGGGTDEYLSNQLGISLSAVKKTWRSIYERVSVCIPELSSRTLRAESCKLDRGREKKQHLLAYLREHPEELRPVSRKPPRPTN